MLNTPECVHAVRRLVGVEQFFIPMNKLVYQTLLKIWDDGKPLQNEIILDEFNQNGKLEQVGGMARVTWLRNLGASPEDAITHARIIADRALQRGVMAVGTRLITEGATADPHELIRAIVEEMSMMNGSFGSVGDLRILQSSISCKGLIDSDIRMPESIVGDGVLTENSFALLYGRPGLGKTWLMLQMAISIALGMPWLGLPTKQRRVGIVELEMHTFYLRQRFDQLLGLIDESRRAEAMENIEIICRPNFTGIVDLGKEASRNGITTWMKERSLGVLCLDALSRMHFAKEIDAQEMGLVLSNIERIRDETGAGITGLHHEPKASSDKSKEIGDLDAARGSSRLQSDPHTMMRLKMKQGKLVLVFPKMNLGPEQEAIWLERGDDGNIRPSSPPGDMGEVKERNRERIQHLLDSTDYKIKVEGLAEKLEMSSRTVRRHLKEMGLKPAKDGSLISLFTGRPASEGAPRSEEGAPVDAVGAVEDEADATSDGVEVRPLVKQDSDLPF